MVEFEVRGIGILLTMAGGSSHSGATCEPVYPAIGHIAEMLVINSRSYCELSISGGRAIGHMAQWWMMVSAATCEPVYPAIGHIAEVSRAWSSTVSHTVSCQSVWVEQ